MPIVDNAAAIAQAAQIQQAVQAVMPAPGAVPSAAATITNEPVVLPNTGAAPEQAPAPVNVELPAVGNDAGTQAGATEGTSETDAAAAGSSAPAVPLTKAQQLQGKIDVLVKRIEADTKKREQLEALLRSVDLLDGVKAGSIIVARVGRAETSKDVTAQVMGVSELENGDKRFKIFYGEGISAELAVIQESQILDVKQV